MHSSHTSNQYLPTSNTSYQYSLSRNDQYLVTYPINQLPIHPINTPTQPTLLATLPTHLVNPTYQHTLSTQPINPPYPPPLLIYVPSFYHHAFPHVHRERIKSRT